MKFDVIVIGGGWTGCTIAERLVAAGMNICLVSEGLSLAVSGTEKPYARLAGLQKLGVTVLCGDRAAGGEIAGDKAVCITTRNLGRDTVLEADTFFLATGKFFSRGLLSDMQHVWEPVFGADVYYDPDRTKWSSRSFDDHQPFMDFGVRTDNDGHVLISGKAVVNLYAAGDILAAGSEELDIDSFIEDYEHRVS